MLNVLLRLFINLTLVGIVVFAAAGRLDWYRGWLFIGLWLFTLAVNFPIVALLNPRLVPERFKRRDDIGATDKRIILLYTLGFIVMLVLAGLDDGRFGWSGMTMRTAYAGILLHFMGDFAIVRALVTNPFLETGVRIQHDRDQHVVTTGPYRRVRHPMYLGMILMLLGTPLIIGSIWAYVPVAAMILLLVVRTSIEDAMLNRELPGYTEYAARTPYRLFPWLW